MTDIVQHWYLTLPDEEATKHTHIRCQYHDWRESTVLTAELLPKKGEVALYCTQCLVVTVAVLTPGRPPL